jgi:hypothetical protein
MNVWRRISNLNLWLGIVLILAVNTIGALPRIYKGVQHPIGPETVSVYSPRGEGHEILTPVEDTGFVDTGERVRVYIRNWYKDDMITFYPRWTLLIALCMAIIHLGLLLLKPRRTST